MKNKLWFVFVFQNSIIEDKLENIRQNCQQISELENQLEFCKKSCAEKAAEICNKNSEIEKLEGNFKDAKEKIAAKVNELEQRESELTVLNQKFETATSSIEENNKTIQVTLCCCLKHFPHFTVISCQKFLLELPNQYSYTFFHRKPLKVLCFSYRRWVNYLLVPHFT